QVPYYGAPTLVTGFSLEENDLVYFAGVNCVLFLKDAASGDTCPGPDGQPWNSAAPISIAFNDDYRYWRMGQDPTNCDLTNGAVTKRDTPSCAGTGPQNRAGMAAARGYDTSGNPIIVAWGGIYGGTSGNLLNQASNNYIYVL